MRINSKDRMWLQLYRTKDVTYARDVYPWYHTLGIRLLWALMFLAPFGVRIIYVDNKPYLIRGHWTPRSWFVPRLYLHYFAQSDQEDDVHNHPMSGVSIILTRGYTEHRLVEAGDAPIAMKRWTTPFQRKPWRPFGIDRNTYHRVELSRGRCWTLFITGRRVGPSNGYDWGFVNIDSGKYTPWGQYKHEDSNHRVLKDRKSKVISRGPSGA